MYSLLLFWIAFLLAIASPISSTNPCPGKGYRKYYLNIVVIRPRTYKLGCFCLKAAAAAENSPEENIHFIQGHNDVRKRK